MFEKFKTGNPIWVYYVDIDSGANLIVPQLLRGRIGEKYQVDKKKFPNYNFVKVEGDLTGTFDMTQRNVKLFYRKQSWGEVQDINMFLKLEAPTVIYDTVEGMPVGQPLPQDIIIKAFQRVATKDGQFWYEIGADQWIKYEKMHVVDDPFNNDQYIPSRLENQLTVLQLNNVKATVDYIPGKSVDVYDAPYGNQVDKVDDGQEVILTKRLSDSDELTWYEIGPKQFISGNYVKIEEDR
ncbi:MAG: MucBP domain-containing protein [Lactobacillaceae bacterium]|nr:MucBP domain-containing protein [Lactobacillaceae bacterium]